MAPAMVSMSARASAEASASGIARLLPTWVGETRGSLRLPEGLLGRLALIELGGLALGGGDAQRLLQELAGLEAVGAGVALGLHGHLAARRDRDLDDAGHRGSS